MSLKLYNTLTRTKEDFVPIDPANVRLYVCGPTVYDYAHIGNARPVIVFDVLFRLLRHVYGADHVTYVRNITDVDDKINARAVRDYPGVPPVEAIRTLTETTYGQFQADVAALGCLPPTFTPRATEHVATMVALIERLIARGYAYAAEGHALFHVPAMKAYGALARRSLDDMIAGARVDVAPYKRDPMDFVLWKPSSDDEPGWPSPWGRGRPGWHIECSAMSLDTLITPSGGGFQCDDPLKNTFDIHGGGIDLVFPHHENEIAQTSCALGTPRMANVWMHNGFLQVEGEKMSKSLGNFTTIRDLLADWPGEVLRLTMLRSHYHQPIDWTVRGMEESWRVLDDWYAVTADAGEGAVAPAVLDALADDLNTPKAIAELHGLKQQPAALAATLRMLGFLADTPAAWAARRPAADVDAAAVNALVAARLAARKAKNFAESDRLRDELAALGVTLKDGKDPATGEPVTTWEAKR
ncbi:cysteine--tRNA ligase [Mongoliimonas terrestris]|uniref:cysteine--tRNA ligase n=1 Tax=Mongoliimonas terrestris TaxID=1709001 RepID=UPI000949A17A|nr:cysteine--tRNA ligase [Mongoliimonas terrestris]